jgi:hypothetical protein
MSRVPFAATAMRYTPAAEGRLCRPRGSFAVLPCGAVKEGARGGTLGSSTIETVRFLDV